RRGKPPGWPRMILSSFRLSYPDELCVPFVSLLLFVVKRTHHKSTKATKPAVQCLAGLSLSVNDYKANASVNCHLVFACHLRDRLVDSSTLGGIPPNVSRRRGTHRVANENLM